MGWVFEQPANDDTGEQRYINLIEKRVHGAASDAQDLVSALCPSREPFNDACRILVSAAFQEFDEIHLLLLRYKWDLHAQLCLDDIQTYCNNCGNTRLRLHVIDEHAHDTGYERRQCRYQQAYDIIRAES